MKHLLAALALLFAAAAHALVLDATTKSLEMETSTAASTDWYVSFADHTSSAFTPADSEGNVASATTTTIVAAPGASTQRQIRYVTATNRSTTLSQTVRFKIDVSGTERHVSGAVSMAPGESVRFNENGDVVTYDAVGNQKLSTPQTTPGYDGRAYQFAKASPAKDAAGYAIATLTSAGFPGASNLQAPGVNGFGTDCSIASQTTDPNGAAQMGAHLLPDPATGALYLSAVDFVGSVAAEAIELIDVLWYNTGLSATTTTAQAFTMGTLPARSTDGTSNGDGLGAALFVTTALGGAVQSNLTIAYTDSDGNTGNTGTMSGVVGWQIPATAVAASWLPFQLAAGDRGLRDIDSLTLNTSQTSGAYSLMVYRSLATIPVIAAYTGGGGIPQRLGIPPGVRIWPNSCLVAVVRGTATAANLWGTYTIVER